MQISWLPSTKYYCHYSTRTKHETAHMTYADPEIFVRGGPTLTTIFLVDGGERIKIPLKEGHYRLPHDGTTSNAGLILKGNRTSIAK